MVWTSAALKRVRVLPGAVTISSFSRELKYCAVYILMPAFCCVSVVLVSFHFGY